MTFDPADWRTVLRDAVDDESGGELPPDEVLALRRTIVAAAREVSRPRWTMGWVAIAATLALTVGGAVVALRVDRRVPPVHPAPLAAVTDSDRLQLHFATPGGTRIIWVFNQNLDLKGRAR